jgi:ABC-type branched-subunit amino acid transport system ATPase component
MNASALIRVEQVSSRYGQFQILNEVSFGIEARTVHGLIGPNGAGKSTLLDVLSGSHVPFKGRVMFDGRDISRTSAHEVARLGLRRTFQHPRLCWNWSLLENVMMGDATSRDGTERKAARASSALQRVGIGAQALQRADRVDGVTQLRAQIARCLIAAPRVLALDEPSAGMDRRQRNELAALLLALTQEGVTVLLVAHDLPLIRACARTVTVINAGRLIAQAPAHEALEDPTVRSAYLGMVADD